MPHTVFLTLVNVVSALWAESLSVKSFCLLVVKITCCSSDNIHSHRFQSCAVKKFCGGLRGALTFTSAAILSIANPSTVSCKDKRKETCELNRKRKKDVLNIVHKRYTEGRNVEKPVTDQILNNYKSLSCWWCFPFIEGCVAAGGETSQWPPSIKVIMFSFGSEWCAS